MGRRRHKDRNLPENMRESRGAYYLTHYVDGKQRWTPLGRDLTVAFGRYREILGVRAPIGRTVDDLVTRFELEVIPKKRPNTQRVYRVWLPAIRKTWGEILLKDLRQPDVAVFLDTFPKKVTANRVVTLLVTMLKWAKRWGWVEENRIAGIERHAESARRQIISEDEWKALLAAAEPKYQLLLRLARFTALRRSDVCALTWSCVQHGRLVVTTQKTRAAISIAIRGDLVDVIAELKRGILPHPTRRLFWVSGGRPLSSAMLGYHFDRIRVAAGLRYINFHDIRRTRLTELGERYGKEFAQRLAAHADVKTTERYIVPEVVEIDWPEDEIRGAV
jgi:integrase